VRGRFASWNPRARNHATSDVFCPSMVRTVELTRPLEPIDAARSPPGLPYGGVFVLARLRREPVGLVTLTLPPDGLSAHDVAEALWDALGERVRSRVRSAGAGVEPSGPDCLLRGLGDLVAADATPAPSPDDAPLVTVIVPTKGRGDSLERCLHSLRALRYPHFDVLVVDNRPSDPATRRVVEAHAAEDQRIGYTSETRPGSSVARNHGIARTTSEIVAFTDDDVIVDPDWLAGLVRPFLRNPAVAAVTGLVLPGELETRAQWCFEHYRGFGRGVESRLFDLDRNRADDRLFYPYLGSVFGSGNSMAFRRAALWEIGGFDPALGAGSVARAGSDVEALSQLVLGGSTIAYEPTAICWHTHRQDEEALRQQLFNYGIGLTAILTKWSLRRPSLLLSVVRAIPQALRGAPSAQPGQRPGLPPVLRRREIMGYLLGPIFYVRSVRWTRRLQLDKVLKRPAPELDSLS